MAAARNVNYVNQDNPLQIIAAGFSFLLLNLPNHYIFVSDNKPYKMNTFFQQLAGHCDKLTVNISVTKIEDELVVSLLTKPLPDKDGEIDDSISTLAPVIIRGTPEELDNDFFSVIKPTITKSEGIYVNSTEFDDSVTDAALPKKEKGKRSSKTEPAKTTAKKIEEKKANAWDAELEKALEHVKNKNYTLAVSQLAHLSTKYPKSQELKDELQKARDLRDGTTVSKKSSGDKKKAESAVTEKPEPVEEIEEDSDTEDKPETTDESETEESSDDDDVTEESEETDDDLDSTVTNLNDEF